MWLRRLSWQTSSEQQGRFDIPHLRHQSSFLTVFHLNPFQPVWVRDEDHSAVSAGRSVPGELSQLSLFLLKKHIFPPPHSLPFTRIDTISSSISPWTLPNINTTLWDKLLPTASQGKGDLTFSWMKKSRCHTNGSVLLHTAYGYAYEICTAALSEHASSWHEDKSCCHGTGRALALERAEEMCFSSAPPRNCGYLRDAPASSLGWIAAAVFSSCR